MEPGEIFIKTTPSGKVIRVQTPTEWTLDQVLSWHGGDVFHDSGVMATARDFKSQTEILGIDTSEWVRVASAVRGKSGTFPVLYNGRLYYVGARPYGNNGTTRIVDMSTHI